MNLGVLVRRYWQELLLVLMVTLPWLSLLVLGIVWLWQGGHVAIWAITAAALGLLAWPLSRSVRRRANAEARHALGDLAAPAGSWNAVREGCLERGAGNRGCHRPVLVPRARSAPRPRT